MFDKILEWTLCALSTTFFVCIGVSTIVGSLAVVFDNRDMYETANIIAGLGCAAFALAFVLCILFVTIPAAFSKKRK